MLIRACVRSQGKGSYKHKALISSGSYLLNEEKGAKKKALISIQALIKVGSYKHTTTVSRTVSKDGKSLQLVSKKTLRIATNEKNEG